jgi:signal transduction histidine kinase/ActR/RegA family two-component response regulator
VGETTIPALREDDRGLFLSTLPAGRRERRLACAVVLSSAALFLAIVPFAQVRLAPVWAFIPVYQSAFVVNDVVTAVLLFGQFSILRERALLVLASGYLFTALMAIVHGLTFPGLFAPTGLLGAGPHTTAWLYMFWHGGFPILVIAYAALKGQGRPTSRTPGQAAIGILTCVAAVLVAAATLAFLATAGQGHLPALMRGNQFAPAQIVVMSTVWALSLLALVVLWRRRPYSLLDLWLMVVMVAWLFDIALSGVVNASRFDLGFYAGRVYGLLAASLVLMLLLVEHGKLYARLLENFRELRLLQRQLQQQNERLEEQVHERTRQLVEAEKLATMGNLLAGVAHELNNPLAAITGNVALLIEHAPDDRVRRRGQMIESAAARCVRIITNFLAMARRHPVERARVNVNGVLREAVEILGYQLRVAATDVIFDLPDTVPPVWADPHQLQQVAVNLITNAYHAMRGGASPRRLTVASRYDAQHARVIFSIADTGPGIPPDVQPRIFEPFFTTKPEGQGTGLGLSLCRGMIESHGGAIRVESAPGQGATFEVELPLGRPPASVATAASAVEAPLVPGQRILVVDAEPDVAGVLAEALAGDGYVVDVVGDGAAALAKVEENDYDLIISDCSMPGVGGIELHRELARRRPDLAGRMVFISGDTLNESARQAFWGIDTTRVAKPFTLSDVRAVVRQALQRTGGAKAS